jgi:lipopolysaccharide transport protein LptA
MLRNLINLTILNLLIIFIAYANELKISSDKLEVDRENKISIFSGSVYAYNEDIKIWSEELIVKFNNNENKIQQLNAKKKVKIINQEITATGKTAIYDPNLETLQMYGNVEVTESKNFVICDELFLDIKNSTSIMTSVSSNRVEAFIVSE